MAKKRSKLGLDKIDDGIFLLISIASGVLFSFGLLNWFNQQGYSPVVPVVIGAVLTLILIVWKKYTTETAFALRRK